MTTTIPSYEILFPKFISQNNTDIPNKLFDNNHNMTPDIIGLEKDKETFVILFQNPDDNYLRELKYFNRQQPGYAYTDKTSLWRYYRLLQKRIYGEEEQKYNEEYSEDPIHDDANKTTTTRGTSQSTPDPRIVLIGDSLIKKYNFDKIKDKYKKIYLIGKNGAGAVAQYVAYRLQQKLKTQKSDNNNPYRVITINPYFFFGDQEKKLYNNCLGHNSLTIRSYGDQGATGFFASCEEFRELGYVLNIYNTGQNQGLIEEYRSVKEEDIPSLIHNNLGKELQKIKDAANDQKTK